MWHSYVNTYHCPEYEELTIEEKLLVNVEMREWFKNSNLADLCVPTFIFKATESRVIEKLKEENDKRNRKSGASGTDSK